MIRVILTMAFIFSIGYFSRLVPQAASAWPKVAIFTCTTPICVQTIFRSDASAQTAAADVEVVTEQIQPAIDRLVGFVRRSSGEERDRARQHLLELFAVLDPEDQRIVVGRRSLSNALY